MNISQEGGAKKHHSAVFFGGNAEEFPLDTKG